MNSVLSRAYQFIFKPQSANKVAIFRIAFGGVALLSELLNLSHLTQYYTNSGYFDNSLIRHMEGLSHISPLSYISSSTVVVALYWLLIVATICFITGFYSRPAAIIVFVLLLSFGQRNVLLQYGGDRIQRDAFFFCMFLRADSALSLRNYIFKRPDDKSVSGWPVRLIQIQVAFMYFFTAILKIATPQWRQGSYLYSLLNNPNFALFHVPWIKDFALFLALSAYAVLLLEFSFIFLVWWRKTNLPIVLLLVGEHLGIMLTMNATYFSAIMFPLLFLCVDDYYIRSFTSWWKRQRRARWKLLARPQ